MQLQRADTFGRTAIIFDMDGTIVDSMPAWRKSIGETALRYGVRLPDNFYGFIKNLPARQAAEHLVTQCGVREDPVEIFRQISSYTKELYHTEVRLKPYAGELLESYREQGIATAILTGTDRELLDALLEQLDLARYFDGVWSCREAGGAKSSIAPFDFVLERLGKQRADAAVLEDGLGGAATASRHGMYTVGVYDETSKEEIPQFLELVDRYVYSLDELFVGEPGIAMHGASRTCGNP